MELVAEAGESRVDGGLVGSQGTCEGSFYVELGCIRAICLGYVGLESTFHTGQRFQEQIIG